MNILWKDLWTDVLTTFLSRLISPSKMHIFSNGFFPLVPEMLLVRLISYRGCYVAKRLRKLTRVNLYGTPLVLCILVDSWTFWFLASLRCRIRLDYETYYVLFEYWQSSKVFVVFLGEIPFPINLEFKSEIIEIMAYCTNDFTLKEGRKTSISQPGKDDRSIFNKTNAKLNLLLNFSFNFFFWKNLNFPPPGQLFPGLFAFTGVRALASLNKEWRQFELVMQGI